jgi:hypothetical protein
MSIQVETKDCTALTDNELSDMADMGAGLPGGIDIGLLSKAKEDWVLCTTAHLDDKLQGIMFSTLERIGGTPCVLLGLVSVKHTSRRESIMRGLMNEAYHRALMAFPDEDVLVGTRFANPSGFDAFKALTDIVPRPGHRAVGEERAWGRRLAKRFHVESAYDEQSFQVKANASGLFDYESLKPESVDPDVIALFKGTKPAKGDVLVAFGWAMAEDLLKLGSR